MYIVIIKKGEYITDMLDVFAVQYRTTEETISMITFVEGLNSLPVGIL